MVAPCLKIKACVAGCYYPHRMWRGSNNNGIIFQTKTCWACQTATLMNVIVYSHFAYLFKQIRARKSSL